MRNHFDGVLKVIEHEQRIDEHEERLGKALRVRLWHRNAPLEVSRDIVG